MDTPTGPGSYDKIIKEVMEGIQRPLLEKVLGVSADKVSRLNTLMQLANEREADLVLKVDNDDGGEPYILHAEVQSTNDARMLIMMLHYFIHIYSLYGIRVRQYVVFIGRDKLTMRSLLDMPEIRYKYELIDIRAVACERFLYASVPEEIILSVLCNIGERDERLFVKELLAELMKVAKGLDLSRYLRQLEVLSKLRDMQRIVIEEVEQMTIVYDLETDIRFMQVVQKGMQKGWEGGRQEGRVEGMQNMLEALLRAKFGEKGLSLMQKIRGCEDESRLYAITEALTKAEDITEVEGLL
ncbi:MAG: hypothetical protein HQL06_11175 [Nitrospirae bacterium]|nr:hypothetical protein [Nitrospirota bacterium]